MLQLVFGRAGSGKSEILYKEIERRAAEGQSCVLLLPEQFTAAAELMLPHRFGEAACHYIRVESFGRLCRTASRQYGGVSDENISVAGRVVVVKQAVNAVLPQLKYYAKSRKSPQFFLMCADVIEELKIGGATEKLLDIAKTADDGGKLYDIALIFAAYNTLLCNKNEPHDKLFKTATEILKNPDFCDDTSFFADDFIGFTAPEYALLGALIQTGKKITFALPTHRGSLGSFVFSSAGKTAMHLYRIATSAGVDIAVDIQLDKDLRSESDGLLNLNLLLCGETYYNEDKSGVSITPYKTREDEAFAVAAAIHRDVRSGNRYRDFAVTMRSIEPPPGELLRAFTFFNIPVYYNSPNELRFCSTATFVNTLFTLQSGITTEKIFSLLYTGLCDIKEEDICALWNYTLRYDPSQSEWKTGFVRYEGGEIPLSIERCRDTVARRIIHMQKSAESNTAEAIYNTMQDFKVPQNIGDDIRNYNLVISALEELNLLTAKSELSPEELRSLFALLLQNTQVHTVPQTRDAVQLAPADRLQNEGVKIVFVMGANAGVFPADVGYSGLFSHKDREFLVEHELLLPGLYENRMVLEEMYFYKALTAAKNSCHISYISGKGNECCPSLQPIIEFFGNCPLELCEIDYCATKKAAAVRLSLFNAQKADYAKTLEAALFESGDSAVCYEISAAASICCYNLKDPAIVKKLLGDKVYLSQSRTSQFQSCGFAYLLKYILKLRPIRKLELSADVAGNLVHYILEHLLQETEDFENVSPSDLAKKCDELVAEYIKNIFGNQLPKRIEFLIKRLKNASLRLAMFMQEEQKRTLFRPEAFEAEIPLDGDDSYTLKTEDGNNIIITGKVDRIDSFILGGERYIRVVDYKTGNKTFKLIDVYYGLDIQLLLYMFYAQKGGAVATGAVYLSSEPNYNQTTGEATYMYDGMVTSDPDILAAFDYKTLPVSFKSDGTPYAFSQDKLFDIAKAGRIKKHIEELLCRVAQGMYRGNFDAVPLCERGSVPCDYCDYGSVCRHTKGQNERQKEKIKNLFCEE